MTGEKTEPLKSYFAFNFSQKETLNNHGYSAGKRREHQFRKNRVLRENSFNLNEFTSPDPVSLNPKLLKKLESLSIISENSWRISLVSERWRRENVILVFKKRKEEEPGNHRPVSLTYILGKASD